MNHSGSKPLRGFFAYLLMLGLLTFLPVVKSLGIGKLSLVSVTQSGAQDTSMDGTQSFGFLSISPNGRFVAFATYSPTFSGDTTYGRTHVFVKDRQTGELAVASTTNSTNLFANNSSSEPTISDPIPPSGQSISYCDSNPTQCKIRVAFLSTASNLGVNTSTQHIYIKEFDLNLDPLRTVLVSANSSGTAASVGSSHPKISGDGQYVFFVNGTSDLTTEYTYSMIWRKQILASGTTGTATLVTSVQCEDTSQTPHVFYLCTNGYGNYPAPSYDGRYVVYLSGATNLVSGGTNGKVHIFFQDMSLGTREIASVSSSSVQGDKDSDGMSSANNYVADVSDNGERVVFMSKATNLISGGTTDTGKNNIFLRDRATGTTSLVSPEITSSSQSDSGYPNISGNGRFITYCWSPVGGENNQTFLYDIAFNSTQKIKKAAYSTYTRNDFPHVSGDGRYVVLGSIDALTTSDQSSKPDVFVYDVVPFPSKQHSGDFNADGATDLAVFRPGSSLIYWHLASSPTYSTTTSVQFGASGDTTTPGDYDGDGITDIASFNAGTWNIRKSSVPATPTQTPFGSSGDKPVAVDYDGDNKTDIAVWRPSDGTWYIVGSSVGYYSVQFGTNGDKPVPGDYDKDGKGDLAVFRPSNGYWYIIRSGTPSPMLSVQFGASSDIPVQGDYDGDGMTDIAVWRSYDSASGTDGIWYYLESGSGNTFVAVDFGASTDKPVPGDYDNDGKTDKAVFRPATSSQWFVLKSSTGDASYSSSYFGVAADTPIPFGNLP